MAIIFSSDLKQKVLIGALILVALLAAVSSVYNWYEGQKKPKTGYKGAIYQSPWTERDTDRGEKSIY
jgi:hypothetical protein